MARTKLSTVTHERSEAIQGHRVRRGWIASLRSWVTEVAKTAGYPPA